MKNDIPIPQANSMIVNAVNHCFDKADDFFEGKFIRPTISLKQRGRAAGMAYLQKNEVRFNLHMFNQDSNKFLNEVVPHEVAHIIVYQIYGGQVAPHGKEWKAVMLKVFKLEPARTHNFDVPKPKLSFLYQCACQTHELTSRRHNFAQQGRQYACTLCHQPLVFLRTQKNT